MPIVRVTGQPRDGRLTVKQSKVRVSAGGGCPAAEVPGLIARYQSRPGFSGEDKVTIQIETPGDETISQAITIDVKPTSRTRAGNKNATPTASPWAPTVNDPPTAAPTPSNLNQPAVSTVPNQKAEPENSSNRNSSLNGTTLAIYTWR